MSLYLIRQNSDPSSDLDGLGNYEKLQPLSDIQIIVSLKVKIFCCKLEVHFPNMTQIGLSYTVIIAN